MLHLALRSRPPTPGPQHHHGAAASRRPGRHPARPGRQLLADQLRPHQRPAPPGRCQPRPGRRGLGRRARPGSMRRASGRAVGCPQVDIARRYSYVARDDEALTQLLDAEAAAPQIVRHSAAVRDTVKSLHRRARHNAGTTQRCSAWPSAAGPSSEQHRCGRGQRRGSRDPPKRAGPAARRRGSPGRRHPHTDRRRLARRHRRGPAPGDLTGLRCDRHPGCRASRGRTPRATFSWARR